MEEKYIAVMGATGAGKTSLICSLIGAEVGKVGHGLTSETQDITAYPFEFAGYRIVLVDTPGFDDTYKSDHDILEQLINWLTTSYEGGTRLSGILYLHRITDNRTQGSTIRNLLSFRQLCGEECYRSVVLLTSFWKENGKGEELFESRYRELTEGGGLWHDMLERGAQVCKGEVDKFAVLSIIMKLLRSSPATLQIQREVVDEKRSFAETSVVSALVDARISQQQQIFNAQLAANSTELTERLRRQSQTSAQHLQTMDAKYQKELAELQKANEDLRAKFEEISSTGPRPQQMQPADSPPREQKPQPETQEVCRMPEWLKQQREQKYYNFNQTIFAAIESLSQGQRAGLVKCSILPRKSSYLLVCRNCFKTLGSSKYYACIACGPQDVFALCETCYQDPQVSCNVTTHPKQSSFRVAPPRLARCPRIRSPPQNQVLLCKLCRQNVGSCYLHCCECSERWDMCLQCATRRQHCPGHGRGFPWTAHQLEVCARYLG